LKEHNDYKLADHAVQLAYSMFLPAFLPALTLCICNVVIYMLASGIEGKM